MDVRAQVKYLYGVTDPSGPGHLDYRVYTTLSTIHVDE
jgi:hypothetical protein